MDCLRKLESSPVMSCGNCGAPLEGKEAGRQMSPGVLMGEDGVMRWVYEMNMWKNPTLLITIWKVLLLATMVPALLMFFLTLGDGFGTALLVFLKIMAVVAAIVTGLMVLAYPMVALINGNKYCVIFEMDDNGVKHIQMQKQFEKNQVFAMVVTLAGVMTGSVQTAAAGMLAGSKQSLRTSFKNVKTITVKEKRHVIYLNEKLTHNQVYANPDDFGFVREHILSCCKNAKMTSK